jgi:DNA topoisomerase I
VIRAASTHSTWATASCCEPASTAPTSSCRGSSSADGADENGRRIVNIPEGTAPDELTLERAKRAGRRAAGERPSARRTDPDTGFDIIVKDGRYGPYVTARG